MNHNNTNPRDDIVAGRNAVLELLKTGRHIECVYLQKGISGTVLKIAAIARDKGIVIKDVPQQKLDELCGGERHQGVAAQTSSIPYSEMDDVFKKAKEQDVPPFIVIADEIEDPHNLGAIIRSAEAAGAHGLIIPKRRSAGLSLIVSKTSAGAALHLPVVRVSNLVSAIEALKSRGVWIYAADTGGGDWCRTDFSGAVALVIGSEGRGIGRLIKEKCDFTVSLPMLGKLSSLNASVAAGVIMYEIARQRLNIPART
ncbi:MAG: 23S rRNA (guanosine(2251)-2'-O)-methyltransferase RlmB [Oscillospiraceae bacterium]|nr:23S rRNA (guanosine(2251)-2'-O)-methyltransferase RlmB [Oscillospiraceae bacterium]